MQVKLTSNVYGAWRGNIGDIVDCEDAEALDLIKHRRAVAVPAPVSTPPEDAPVSTPPDEPIDLIAPAPKAKAK